VKLNIYHHTFYTSPKKSEMIRSTPFVQTISIHNTNTIGIRQ